VAKRREQILTMVSLLPGLAQKYLVSSALGAVKQKTWVDERRGANSQQRLLMS